MNYNELIGDTSVKFDDMPPGAFLLGLLSAFDNRYQACADSFFKEITWKQFFAIICIKVCGGNPTINQLSEVMGSSHQNVKQILIKLEKAGFVNLAPDEQDRRKQRIRLTEKCMEFCNSHEAESQKKLMQMFEGISNEEFYTAIRVIGKMESNIKQM